MWLAPVFTKQELTTGSRKWGHLPTIGIPKAIYHYMTNTTKQQRTYQLFQNIMRQKINLSIPKDDKIHFYLCFLPVAATTLQVTDLWSWANGPIRVDLGVTWLAKWRGIPGGQGERMLHIGLWEGLAHFNVMQNRDNLYFPRATHWIKNTFHVILFLLQNDEMHFILINRNISKSILILNGNILGRVRHALSQISWEKLLLKWWLVSLSKWCRI